MCFLSRETPRDGKNPQGSEPLRPEHELLLCCARTRLDGQAAARMRTLLLRDDFDWPGLLAAAQRHGLRPLLYWHLTSRFPESVPPSVMDELYRHFVLNRARNLSLSAELVRVLAMLDAAGIPALPLKGPVLAQFLYGNIAYREFDDLDILIPEVQLDAAGELLGRLGYRPTQGVPRDQRAAFRKAQYEIPYRHERNATCVEIHWKCAPDLFPCALRAEDLWTRCGWTELAGVRIRTLGLEDTLLFLCAHGSRHNWDKIEWICGISEMVREHPSLDWQRILRQSGKFHAMRVLLFGFAMAGDLLGAELPAAVRDMILQDRALARLVADARASLFAAHPAPASALHFTLRQARMTDRGPDRLRMLVRMLFRPKYHDWEYFQLPAALAFLYYPLRLIRLLAKLNRAKPGNLNDKAPGSLQPSRFP
jgi:hypothetical protein